MHFSSIEDEDLIVLETAVLMLEMFWGTKVYLEPLDAPGEKSLAVAANW